MYKHGQFLIHLAGCYRNGKSHGLKEMMDIYCPLKMDEETEEEFLKRKNFLKSLI
jgi:hypothetical protein